MTKKVEITLLEDNELSIDGQTKPAGNIHIEEYEDNAFLMQSFILLIGFTLTTLLS